MATTSSTLTTGKANAGQGSNGKHSKGRSAGLVATAALGLSLLTGMVVSQVRQEVPPVAGSAASIAQAGGAEQQFFLERNTQLPSAGTLVTQGAEQQVFLVQNLTLPSGTLPGAAAMYDQFRYVEQNLALPTEAPTIVGLTSERQWFLAQNTQLPTAGTPAFVPDRFTDR